MLVLSDEKYSLNSHGYIYTRWNLTENTGEHQHLYYEVIFVFSGTLVHAVNGTRQYLEPNTLVLIRPTDTHSLGALNSKRYKYYNVMVSLEEIDAIFDCFGSHLKKEILSLDFPPLITFSYEDGQAFLKNLETISSGAYSGSEFRYMSRLLFSQILYKFAISESYTSKTILPHWFNTLLIEMQQQENFMEGVPALLRLSGKNHTYLCRVFRRYLNTTPVSYVNDVRMNYVEYMLRTTDLPIINIILDAGFNNISHFNHIFKEKFGCSPTVYRSTSRLTNIDLKSENIVGEQTDRAPTKSRISSNDDQPP